jgi:hypothetical protein
MQRRGWRECPLLVADVSEFRLRILMHKSASVFVLSNAVRYAWQSAGTHSGWARSLTLCAWLCCGFRPGAEHLSDRYAWRNRRAIRGGAGTGAAQRGNGLNLELLGCAVASPVSSGNRALDRAKRAAGTTMVVHDEACDPAMSRR